MGKEYVMYIYTVEYYSVIKKNEVIPFAAICMDLEIILSEVNQIKTIIIQYYLHVRSKKLYKRTYNRETDS